MKKEHKMRNLKKECIYWHQLELHRRWLDTEGEQGELLDWRGQCFEDMDFSAYTEAAGGRLRLNKALLSGADFSRARFAGIEAEGALLYGTNFTDASFDTRFGCQVNFRGATLAYAAFKNVSLLGADFEGAVLHDACFENAILSFANLANTNLVWANMRNATLYKADLYGTDLRCACLTGASLELAKSYAGFENVGSCGRTLHCTLHDDGWHFFTGCFGSEGSTLEAFVAAVRRKHAASARAVRYLAIAEYLQKMEPFYRKGEL